MFQKKNTNELHIGKIDSIIGADAVLTGTFTTTQTTRVDGVVKGDIISEGTLIIGAGGKVTGNISSVNIMVSGTVEGELKATEKIEVSCTGVVLGNIETKCLFVDENAVFQGQCNMRREMKPAVEESAPQSDPE